jgi:hypothetical protein
MLITDLGLPDEPCRNERHYVSAKP